MKITNDLIKKCAILSNYVVPNDLYKECRINEIHLYRMHKSPEWKQHGGKDLTDYFGSRYTYLKNKYLPKRNRNWNKHVGPLALRQW